MICSIIDDESPFLHISMRLYFYVIVRNLLKDYGVDDRNVADYIAELLYRYGQFGARTPTTSVVG